ncbi:MAG: dephospho-CoA kinase, partial [Syntrophomonadaceae bacterium]|nr:dephospho-CoA kinase [Syntrophomonadaceae bacterium]
MRIIGLTGGIASGKSTVSKVFRELGAYIIDADEVAHQIIEPGQPAWRDVINH